MASQQPFFILNQRCNRGNAKGGTPKERNAKGVRPHYQEIKGVRPEWHLN